jgi:hypothetical protein
MPHKRSSSILSTSSKSIQNTLSPNITGSRTLISPSLSNGQNNSSSKRAQSVCTENNYSGFPPLKNDLLYDLS